MDEASGVNGWISCPLQGFIRLKSLGFSHQYFFQPRPRNKTPGHETIFCFWRRYPETAHGYQIANATAGTAGTETGDRQMRTISFILAFAFILAGPSMAGSSDNGLPGIGTFSYNGSPVTSGAPQSLVVAAN